MRITEILTEAWSQKYKSSINCSHPKGFSQKAHCAGKKKHNESVEMEMVCESCGMCETHGNITEIKKGQKDANGVTRCWPGKHAEGTKKGKNGGQVRNCVPNESQGVAEGFLNEGLAHPVIVVDVQPEYSGMNDGNESSVFPQIINFVNKQTGPVLMFVNAEDQGLSGDTIQDIKQYWDDTICPEEERYTHDEETDDYIETPNCPKINWQRFAIADKGYGYFRSWMDHGIEPATIVATIRELYQQKKSDSRELQFPAFNKRTPQQSLIMGAMEEMEGDPISVNWTSVSQLKRFNGAYIVGGARDQCLREVELLMNAFNIKYKRIDSLMYEGKKGVAEGGAETSWSNDTGTITLQDILELTKHIKQINLPINDNLKSKLLHWEGNPEEIERVNQVTVSNQFPILIMVDEQGQIAWILDGNHRLHKAIQSRAKTIPAKLIKPSNLNDKAKKIFNIKEQGVAEGLEELSRILDLSGLSLTADEQFDIIESMVESWALHHGVDAEVIWEDFESVDDSELLDESAAWRRKEGKSKKGGLNAKGVASYRRENPGSKLQTAVTTKPSKLKPGSKAAKRRKSFCARMGGVKGPMKKPNGKPTRKALALRKWNC